MREFEALRVELRRRFLFTPLLFTLHSALRIPHLLTFPLFALSLLALHFLTCHSEEHSLQVFFLRFQVRQGYT